MAIQCEKCFEHLGEDDLAYFKSYGLFGRLLCIEVRVKNHKSVFEICNTCYDDIVLEVADKIKEQRAK